MDEYHHTIERISTKLALSEVEQCGKEGDRLDRILHNVFAGASDLETELQQNEILDELTKLALKLGLRDPTLEHYYAAISKLDDDEYNVDMATIQLSGVAEELDNFLRLITHEEETTRRWTKELKDSGPSAEMEREKRLLLSKAKEYQEELSQLETTNAALQGTPSISELLATQDRLKAQRKEVDEMKQRLKAYQGLPPDMSLARLELERARGELYKLQQKRDDALGKMASKVS